MQRVQRLQEGFNLYDQLERAVSSANIGDIASDHIAELEGFRGFNYVAIMAAAKQAARAVTYIYDDGQNAAHAAAKRIDRRARRLKGISARQHDGVVLPTDHPLARLCQKPNPSQTGSNFLMERFIQLRLHGSAIVFNRPNVSGTRTVERYVIPVALCVPIQPGSRRNMPFGGIRVVPNNRFGVYSPEDVSDAFSPMRQFMNIELPAEVLSFTRYPHPFLKGDGASPTWAASSWIDTATKLDDMRFGFFDEGPNGRVVVTCDSEDIGFITSLEDRLEKAFAQDGRRVTVLGKGGAIVSKRSAEDLGLDVGHDQMRDSIFAAHGMSKALVGMQEGLTYGALVAALFGVIAFSIQPDMDLMADEDTLDLGPEYGPGVAVEYEVPTVNDPELKERQNEAKKNSGAYTVGEYRRDHGDEPFGDERDDLMMTASGPVPVERLLGKALKEPTIPAMPNLAGLMTDGPKSIRVDRLAVDDDTVGVLEAAGYRILDLFDEGESDLLWNAWMDQDVMEFAKSMPDSPRRQRLLKALEEQKVYQYGCVLLPLPDQIAASMLEIAAQIPDEALGPGGREVEPHVTLLYGLHGISAGDVVDVVRRMDAPTITLGNVGAFPEGKDGVPLFVEVDSPAMVDLNRKLKDAVPHVVTHPGYIPHATVAYVTPEYAAKMTGQPVSVTRLAARLPRAVVSMPSESRVVVPLRQRYEQEPQAQPAAKVYPKLGDILKREVTQQVDQTVEDIRQKTLSESPTEMAARMVSRMGVPYSMDQYRKALRTVAERVAVAVGRSPTEVLEKEIDPTVFVAWRHHAEWMDGQRTKMEDSQTLVRDAIAKQQPPEVNVTVNVPEQQPPVVNVTTPEQATPVVNVSVPEQQPPVVNVQVPEQPAPQVSVSVPEQAPPVVNVQVPKAEKPDVRVVVNPAKVDLDLRVDAVMPERKTVTTIERDENDLISRVEQLERNVEE